MKDTTCIHDIFASWCAICKHEDLPSIKILIREENLEIVENLLTWSTTPQNRRRIT